MANKPGDIKMIFGNPIKCEGPIDQGRLIKKIRNVAVKLEEWRIEYLNEEGQFYTALIKKNTDGTE